MDDKTEADDEWKRDMASKIDRLMQMHQTSMSDSEASREHRYQMNLKQPGATVKNKHEQAASKRKPRVTNNKETSPSKTPKIDNTNRKPGDGKTVRCHLVKESRRKGQKKSQKLPPPHRFANLRRNQRGYVHCARDNCIQKNPCILSSLTRFDAWCFLLRIYYSQLRRCEHHRGCTPPRCPCF